MTPYAAPMGSSHKGRVAKCQLKRKSAAPAEKTNPSWMPNQLTNARQEPVSTAWTR